MTSASLNTESLNTESLNTAARLGLFGLALVVVFLLAYVAGDHLVPHEVVTAWTHAAGATGH